MSIAIGATPDTRGSTAAVSHDVQPRFEAPATVNDVTGICQRCSRERLDGVHRTHERS